MKLSKVTFTGIDERTDLKRLAKLQEEYPFAEFGILLSYDWKENGNRFPSPEILSKFDGLGLNLSAHFCGQAAVDVVLGKRFKIQDLFGTSIKNFRRCQLNIKADGYLSNLRKLPPVPFIDEVIVQMHTPEQCRQFLFGEHPKNMSFLLDGSGGRGISTPLEIVTSPGVHIGYAGGFGPGNYTISQLKILLANPSKERFWIDMETRVRNCEDWFDLDKVETVLKSCSSLLKRFEKQQ